MDMPGMQGMAGMKGTTIITTDQSSATVFAAATSASIPLALATPAKPHEEAASSPGEMGYMASMSGMSSMSNAFHFGVGDTLWFTPLTPTNGPGYAGAILLLILMAAVLRVLTTQQSIAEKRWSQKQPSRCSDQEDDPKMGQIRDRDGESHSGSRLKITRALFQLAIMTIGYLLMLAVMTFNAGYLLAVLLGVFLGELTFGWFKLNHVAE